MSQTTLAKDALARAFKAADTGTMFTTTLTPLVGVGNVQVHYEWLYSACNCHGDEGKNFTWNVNKLNDTQVSLSPTVGYQGMTLYASVRPDWDYYTQMQAPHSADWITAVGGDEEITLKTMDLNVGVFTGLNGKHLMVQPNLTTYNNAFGQSKSGYKVQAEGTAEDSRTKWFMGINALVQSKLDLPLVKDLTADDLEAMLKLHEGSIQDANIDQWKAWTGIK